MRESMSLPYSRKYSDAKIGAPVLLNLLLFSRTFTSVDESCVDVKSANYWPAVETAGALIWTRGKKVCGRDWPTPHFTLTPANQSRRISHRLFRQVSKIRAPVRVSLGSKWYTARPPRSASVPLQPLNVSSFSLTLPTLRNRG